MRMIFMKYKYILFDADDTLLDFKKDEENAVIALFNEKGIEPTPLLVDTYSKINLGLWKQFERGEIQKKDITDRRFTYLLKEMDISGDGIDFDKIYRRHLSEGGIKLSNADIVCSKLKQMGYKLYIVTNGIEEIQTKRLAKAGLVQFFDHVFISEKIGWQKPKTEYFDAVFNKIGCFDRSKYLIVGDSVTSDVLGGKNAGVDTCLLNFRNNENNSDIVPDYIITNLIELLDILESS